jgi:hypothetical protein
MTNEEFNSLKRKLELIFHYLGRTVGLLILVSAYWASRAGVINTASGLLWVFVAAAIGLFGNKVNFDFLKHILNVTKKGSNEQPSDNN